jgi:hypothetical protein
VKSPHVLPEPNVVVRDGPSPASDDAAPQELVVTEVRRDGDLAEHQVQVDPLVPPTAFCLRAGAKETWVGLDRRTTEIGDRYVAYVDRVLREAFEVGFRGRIAFRMRAMPTDFGGLSIVMESAVLGTTDASPWPGDDDFIAVDVYAMDDAAYDRIARHLRLGGKL